MKMEAKWSCGKKSKERVARRSEKRSGRLKAVEEWF